jgi:hypothetical protein
MKIIPETESSIEAVEVGQVRDEKPVSSVWAYVAVTVAGVTIGAMAVALVGRPRPDSAAGGVAPSARVVTAPTSPSPVESPSSPVESSSGTGANRATGPKWTGSSRPETLGDGSRMIAFELPAENLVAIWGQRVRPTLSVRCLSGTTDVFMTTGWAASLEEGSDRHTVRLGFDDNDHVVERWLDSEDYKALFAPDGAATARSVAGASTLRFGFTPYNASPVVADFDVRGFDQLVGSIARLCRWP